MPSIQIICVNDGSTDNSPAVLKEYAARDNRIEIINKPNGGLSSARNAAYSSIKGKYTLFVDSDDWIEFDLCEKAFQKAEESNAPMTVFFYQKEGTKDSRPQWRMITPADKITVTEKLPVLDFPAAWGKLWRTDFLLNNNLYFPEGLVFEDNLVNWQAVAMAEKIAVVPERFYHYRCNPHSITQSKGEHSMNMVPIYKKVGNYLLESGYYNDYKEKYISMKLGIWYGSYRTLPNHFKEKFIQMIRENLTEDDRIFYQRGSRKHFDTLIYRFYRMIDGNLSDACLYQMVFYSKKIVRFPEMIFRYWILKPIKKRFSAGKSKSLI
jgi:glycosyltransferase involved in cell wall biosynthesis